MNEIKTSIQDESKTFIKVDNHEPFKGDLKTDIISSIEMASIVSSLFGGIFSDFCGCKICVNDGRGNPAAMQHVAPNALYVDIYFKDRGPAPEGKMKNIVSIASLNDQIQRSKNANTDEERINRDVNLANRLGVVCSAGRISNIYKVDNKTYEALEKFMVTGPRTRWADHTQEIENLGSPYGKKEVVVRISGLDLNSIITEIYGNKTDGTNYEYVAFPSTAIPNQDEFIMMVTQLDLQAVRDLQRDLGISYANPANFHQYIG